MLQVNQLHLHRNGRAIISDLSFSLTSQQCLFLQGEIGCGKSTLLHALLGFLPISQGEIQWFGNHCQKEADFVPLRGKIGICFQNASEQLFGPTVLDDVAFGPLNQGMDKQQAYDIALQQLERLDITRLKDRSVNTLSGGEQNFTALAGVLAMQPQVLLLDEPTNGLDSKNIQKLTALLKQLHLPMIIASHDLNFTDQLADSRLYFTRED
ncbi:energy-coupling factor ABC transporter ATP-binding protein [Pasteurellaceae bacterium 22721_9_1]